MNLRLCFLLVLTCIFCHRASIGQCLYGDCKNGKGRLQVKDRLYCGTFKNKKLNGLGLVAINLPIASQQSSAVRVNVPQKAQWLAVCMANFVDGEMDSEGNFLFLQEIIDDNFSTDLSDYREYYVGSLQSTGLPEGYGAVYTEYETGGQKKLVADSIFYQQGVPVKAKFYKSRFLTGDREDIEAPTFSKNPNFPPYMTYALYNLEITGKSIEYYNAKKDKKQIVVAKTYTPTRSGLHKTVVGRLQMYTPDGTLVYDGESTEFARPKNPDWSTKKCLSGDCANGSGKLLLNIPIRELRDFRDGVEQVRYHHYAIFEGRFVNNMPSGLFKMWSTCGYDGYEFIGEVNEDFSLKRGKLILHRLEDTYEGSFGLESEALGGYYTGKYFKGLITKERKFVAN